MEPEVKTSQLQRESEFIANRIPLIVTQYIEGAITISEVNMQIGNLLILINNFHFDCEMKAVETK